MVEPSTGTLRVAVTADLHWTLSPAGDRATRALLAHLDENLPDVLILAGDTGVRDALEECLGLFRHLPCAKLFTAGNHDIWAVQEGMDSLEVYSHDLAQAGAAAGFTYLDDGPWVSADRRLAVVGSVNWYDYTLAPRSILQKYPNAMEIFRRKYFIRSRHNDGRFVRLGMTDEEFTGLVVSRVEEHLRAASERAETVLLATHHPPVPELFKPLSADPTDDELIWAAYSGNARMRDIVYAAGKVRYVFCGHTHVYRRERVGGREMVNVGSDYDRKSLVLLDHPSGRITVQWFEGEPA